MFFILLPRLTLYFIYCHCHTIHHYNSVGEQVLIYVSPCPQTITTVATARQRLANAHHVANSPKLEWGHNV